MYGYSIFSDDRSQHRSRTRSQSTHMATPPRPCVEDQRQWERSKSRALGQVDLSRKGSVDEAIVPLVRYVNSRDEYYTSSSCAGRISIFSEVCCGRSPQFFYFFFLLIFFPSLQDRKQAKKGCHWLLVSHDPLELDQVVLILIAPFIVLMSFPAVRSYQAWIAYSVCTRRADAVSDLSH